MSPLVRRRVPTCVLTHTDPPALADGHAVDRYVEIGSLTKVVTGTALTRMAAAGVLALDDPVERWLPEAPATGITLLHLARHTSGLPGCRPAASRPGTRTRRSTAPRCTRCSPAWTRSPPGPRARRRSTPTWGTPSSARP